MTVTYETTTEETQHDISPEVISEMAKLVADGYDVRLDATVDYYALSPALQETADDNIREMEVLTQIALDGGEPNPLLLPKGRPAFEGWGPLTKRAIALHNIYNPNISILGEGIDPRVYKEARIFNVHGEWKSAYEVLGESMGTEKAAKIHGQYMKFITTPNDDQSRLIWTGARDGAGVRTRANSAMQEAATHLAATNLVRDGVTTASLACGAAGPVFALMDRLQQDGISVNKAILADHDPMALASAYSLSKTEEVPEGTLDLKLEDLVDMQTLSARKLTEFIDPNSVDVVDLLGLFEYFPRPLAVALLSEVRKILSPEGIVVFGNMLDHRPQQTFFTEVSLWPPLEQRSLTELFGIVQEAGFDAKKDTRILLPPQGVYSVVSIASSRELGNNVTESEIVNQNEKLAPMGSIAVNG